MGLFGKKKAPQPAATSDAAVSQLAALDALVARVMAGDHGAMHQVWDTVLRLPRLYMVARGEMPNVRPFVGVSDGRPMLSVFTTTARALEFAKRQGLSFGGGAAPSGEPAFAFLDQTPADVIATAARLHSGGVECVQFDPGVGGGYFAPITNLVGMYEHATGNMLRVVAPAGQGEFDHRMSSVEAATDADGREKALNLAITRLYYLPAWFIAAPADTTEIPVVADGSLSRLVAFTDPWTAHAGLKSMTTLLGAPVEVRAVPFPAIVDAVRARLHSETPVSDIVLNLFSKHVVLNPTGFVQFWDSNPGIRGLHGVATG